MIELMTAFGAIEKFKNQDETTLDNSILSYF